MSTARDALSARTIPFMVLAANESSSTTAPAPPATKSLSAAERAALRFQVRGNAIVTGGAGTLGLSASRALLEHGLSGLMIFDVGIPPSTLETLRRDFPGASIAGQLVDMTDEASVAAAVAQTQQQLGPIAHLLCFAGVVDTAHALDMAVPAFRKVLDINTTGSFVVAQAVARAMVAAGGGGDIMFTASISGHRVNYPQPQVGYNVSKAAVVSMKNCLAAEWARFGIRVNSISPGYMDTILNEGDGLKEARDIWAARNPMGRMGQPEELNGVVVLLASNAGSYINGADIVIDGGQVLF